MKKDTFCAILNAVKLQSEQDDKISKVLDSVMDNELSSSVYTTAMTQPILDALESEFDDKFGDISYFIYETDWGRKAKDLHITTAEGKKVLFKKPGDVFDWLMETR